MSWNRFKFLPILLLLMMPFLMGQSGEDQSTSAEKKMPPGDAKKGKIVYEKRCVWCHNWDGNGKGPAAYALRPSPRDFTKGKYKIRTTPSGKLPTDRNLFDAVSKGLHGTAMPAWQGILSEQDISDVVQYIKTLSKKFARWKKKGKPLPEITVGPEIPSSDESIAKGKEIFLKLECFKCHGKSGRASGSSMPGLQDDWKFPVRPANFTKPWNFRGGSRRIDIYRRFNTGLMGTPMPSFADQLKNTDDSWHLVNFIESLAETKKPEVKEIVKAKFTEGDIPMDFDDPVWQGDGEKIQGAEKFYFPLLGQYQIEPRRFWPTVDAVYVRALHNGKEIAFLFEWDDPTKSPIPPTKVYPLQYKDAFYLQLPLKMPKDPTKKPYFIGGDKKRAAGVWAWNSETMKTVLLKGKGLFKTKVVEGATTIETNAVFDDGRWRVIMKRAMKTDNDKELQFETGKFLPISFHAQEGSDGDTGTLRSVSTWYWLILEPSIPPTRYYVAGIVFVLVLGLEFVWIRRQNNA